MMEDFIGTYGNRLIVAVVGVGVALLLLAIALWIIRRRSGSSPFIRGGRNRQPRLQVLDATAVDARRRLVLVRRDNVEHLVMIGGPTDIVIESGIGAIPIVKEVREPNEVPLKTLPRQETEPKTPEPATQQERREALPQQPVVPAPAAAVSAAEEPIRRQPRAEPAAPPVHPSAPPAQPPRPAPVARDVQTTTQQASRPLQTTRDIARPAPPSMPAPAPADTAAPVRPAVQAATVLPVAAAAIDIPAQSVDQRRIEPVVPVAPQPLSASGTEALQPSAPPVFFTAREPVIDQSNAVDFLDAARERVLPTLRQPQQTPSSPPVPPQTGSDASVVVASDAEPRFSDQLASDFESFLEAEIAKGQDAAVDTVPIQKSPEKPNIVEQPITGATPDKDMQKEMARIFGELSVTRDR